MDMSSFDIRPFALPNTPPNEIRFEDPRDVCRIVVTYPATAPNGVKVSYLRKTWPDNRIETIDLSARSHHTAWMGIDDWFNSKWQEAAIEVERIGDSALSVTFKGLHSELDNITDFDVTYRRTLGIRIDGAEPSSVSVYTTSAPAHSDLRVTLDAGKTTPVKKLKVTGHNAAVEVSQLEARVFALSVDHVKPGHAFSYDVGLVTFELDDDMFTISLESLAEQGPIWFEDKGVFITSANDPTTFEHYVRRNRDAKTTPQKVMNRAEQSYSGASHGQPRPHPCACTVGCKHARQRFWIEPNGDIMTIGLNLVWIPGPDNDRFRVDTDGRVRFGLDGWQPAGRFFDPAPILAYNIRRMRDSLTLDQKVLAVPLEKSIFDDVLGDDSIICLSRFTFRNDGDSPITAELPISYSANSGRMLNRLDARDAMDDHLVWKSDPEKLHLRDLQITDASGIGLRGVIGDWHGQEVLRCAIASRMQASQRGEGIVLTKELAPGEQCEVIVKVPYIDLDRPAEAQALAALDYDKCYGDVRKFWREECSKGAKLWSGEPALDALYMSHVAHIVVTDSRMPKEPELVNTSVGSSTYGNYTNESCMILEELDERGLHDEVRKRLDVWLRYQGTVGLKGLFTDHDGVFYGAGGYEKGDSYDQHHGWALWCLAKHYFLTGDTEWLRSVAGQLVKGVDWVHRQRNETKKSLPHSRGWEYGFLAAGALEDVDDYFYWLSTNALTWRGVEWVARALEAIEHPDAARVRAEADDYKKCLIDGFEKNRRNSPIVRLKDGRWVPNYSSRLYRRGRDFGWIREVLEGSVYLLISGLYASDSKQAGWILDEFSDNRYMNPGISYPVYDPENSWIDYGGFSNQPNLLAGLLPHLERDEPEIYMWMFFNAWTACYREEINAMVEHPQPILGFSNSAIYKTSDQANAIKWLRYMFVYANDGLLHFGRAMPREWFRDGNTPYAEDVATHFGKVGVHYRSEVISGRIAATVDLPSRCAPNTTLVRFRHPEKLPIRSVIVNGNAYNCFNAEKGDVDLTGLTGRVEIATQY